MKRILPWLILAAVVLLGLATYRNRSASHLNVTPDAEREIRKAKGQ